MSAIESIGNVIEYIEGHIDERLDIEILARQAALSPFYFHRLFTRLVGMTVMEYVKARRLTVAAKAIRNSSKPLHLVAGSVGYENYENFSRDFKLRYAIQPSSYRADSEYAVVFTPVFDVGLSLAEPKTGDIYINNGMALQVNILLLEHALYAVGISKLAGLARGRDDPGMLWGLFTDEIKAGISNQTMPPVEFGIGLTDYESHGFTYIAARQVDSLCNISEGYTGFTIPAGEYAECQFEAENFITLTNEALYQAADFMLRKWLPCNRDYRFKGGMTIEIYNEASLSGSPPCMRYLFPVDKLHLVDY